MPHKSSPVKLPTVTLPEVLATAKTPSDRSVKTALFEQLGADTYKSWFFDHGFSFYELTRDDISFNLATGNEFVRKTIKKRYGYIIKKYCYVT